jgi:hypothetical protein
MEKVLKVTSSSVDKGYVPGIKIAGKHLTEYGFNKNDMVLVKYSENKIIIEKVTGRELFQRMLLKNPALEKFAECFDLEIVKADTYKNISVKE